MQPHSQSRVVVCKWLGVPLDFKEALRFFRLAGQGDEAAQTNLGWLYRDGLGVPQDYNEAARFYRLAADQGVAVAQAL